MLFRVCRFRADIPAVSTFRAQYASAKMEEGEDGVEVEVA